MASRAASERKARRSTAGGGEGAAEERRGRRRSIGGSVSVRRLTWVGVWVFRQAGKKFCKIF
jgi:hypothetical protein